MKRPWLVYLVTALAACGAAVAIVGLPERSGEATIPVAGSSTTEAPATSTTDPPPTSTTASTTTSTTSTTTTTPPTTSTSTTLPPITDTVPPPTSTDPPATTSPPAERAISELSVVVANGAGVEGLAGSAATLLRDAGFGDVTAANTGPAGVSVVYHDGLDAAAATILDELGLPVGSVGPRGDAPGVDASGEFDIVVVLGADRLP